MNKINYLEEKEVFKCSKCKTYKQRNEFHESKTSSNRPVVNKCKKCRKSRDRISELFKRALKKHKRICPYCQWPKKLIKNEICKGCLSDQGLRQCKKCLKIGFLINFYYNTNKESYATKCKKCF